MVVEVAGRLRVERDGRCCQRATPELNAMGHLWRHVKGRALANRSAHSIDKSADADTALVKRIKQEPIEEVKLAKKSVIEVHSQGAASRRFIHARQMLFVGRGAATLNHVARDGKFLDALL